VSRDEDKRAYFRIDDEVFLSVKKIEHCDADKIEDTHTYFDSFRKSTVLTAKFNQQRTAMAPVLKEINNKDVALASYISMLSDQVDLLASKLQSGAIFSSNEQLQTVNLSAEGMRFHSTEQYKLEDSLEMIFALFPDGDYIPVLAEVVRVESVDDDGADLYEIGVKYSSINDDDKELLIHHILFLQRQILQKKRLAG